MEWRELYPEDDHARILEIVQENWNLDSPLPLPTFTPVCVCGQKNWHARLWLFWDRTAGGQLTHRITHRCDMSIKCQHCGQVVIFGIPLPDEWVEYWKPRLDVQIDFQTGKRIFEAMEKRSDIDPYGWRTQLAEPADSGAVR